MTASQAIKTRFLGQRLRRLAVTLCFSLLSLQVHAQGSSEFQGVRRSVATVIFCGLGGALLGLSTLSFYGKPQDHTGNIYGGLGLGLLAGVAYVMMDSGNTMAQLPSEKHRDLQPPRLQLAQFQPPMKKGPAPQIPLAAYSWTF